MQMMVNIRSCTTARARLLLAAAAAVALAAAAPSASRAQPTPGEHAGGSVGMGREHLTPQRYWYYYALDRLSDVQDVDGRIEGTYFDRMKFNFEIDKQSLQDHAAHTEGYKMAVRKLIALLEAPGQPLSEFMQRQDAELEAKLRQFTGQDLYGKTAWQQWFTAQADQLQWSDAENRLAVTRGEPRK